MPPLARAPVSGLGEQVAEPVRGSAHPHRPEVLREERSGEAGESRPHIGIGVRVPREERLPEGAVADDEPLDGENGRRHVRAAGEAVVEGGEDRGLARGVEVTDEHPR